MNVLIDTSVWSLALRRKKESLSTNERFLVAELSELIREGRARMMRSPFLGQLYEGFVAAEILKSQVNQGGRKELYYFRDHQGPEVDFLPPRPNAGLWLIECTAGKTVRPAMATLAATTRQYASTAPPWQLSQIMQTRFGALDSRLASSTNPRKQSMCSSAQFLSLIALPETSGFWPLSTVRRVGAKMLCECWLN